MSKNSRQDRSGISAPPATSALRSLLTKTAEEHGLSQKDLTVLATQNDPFRIDTPARHRDGEWLAITAQELGLGDRKIHLRGLHYMVIGQAKPDGQPYANTDDDWIWLSSKAGKAARWLGYIPFDQIEDQRNDAPTVRVWSKPDPTPYVSTGVSVEIPDADDITPEAWVHDFRGTQPYKLVMFGEKSSLADVLAPLAEYYHADLYLPTGEISDTLLHQMAKIGSEDGRPMVVLCFSDCDPAGWQMPVSIGRKLQAFKTSLYDELVFEVHRVALTPDQVREHGLPSTPLKATEKRGDRWKESMGVEQTEIDALAALQPDLLRSIARSAITTFYDTSLDRRVSEARQAWEEEAQAALNAQLDPDELDRIRDEAAAKLAELEAEIEAINDALRVDIGDLALPDVEIPQPQPNESDGKPLLDSEWGFLKGTRALIRSKGYL